MARRCQHPFIFPRRAMQLDDLHRTLLPPSAKFYARGTDIASVPCACVACCLGSRFGPRRHELEHWKYSLWGAKRDRAGRAGILHDWSSAAELLTRSDKSFSFRVSSTFTGTGTYLGTLGPRVEWPAPC